MDSVTRANNQLSMEMARDSRPRVTCNKCGSRMTAWVQSKRTGKWYLANGTLATAGRLLPNAADPHFKTCTG